MKHLHTLDSLEVDELLNENNPLEWVENEPELIEVSYATIFGELIKIFA